MHPEREPRSPLGFGVPAFTFMKENAVDMSTLSRSELVGVLLSHDRRFLSDHRLHVADGEPFNGPVIAQQLLLDQKLSAARELVLRDLQTRMRGAPVMSSPQTLREWLRLYCASLEHEIFLALYLDAHHAFTSSRGYTEVCVSVPRNNCSVPIKAWWASR